MPLPGGESDLSAPWLDSPSRIMPLCPPIPLLRPRPHSGENAPFQEQHREAPPPRRTGRRTGKPAGSTARIVPPILFSFSPSEEVPHVRIPAPAPPGAARRPEGARSRHRRGLLPGRPGPPGVGQIRAGRLPALPLGDLLHARRIAPPRHFARRVSERRPPAPAPRWDERPRGRPPSRRLPGGRQRGARSLGGSSPRPRRRDRPRTARPQPRPSGGGRHAGGEPLFLFLRSLRKRNRNLLRHGRGDEEANRVNESWLRDRLERDGYAREAAEPPAAWVPGRSSIQDIWRNSGTPEKNPPGKGSP